MSPQYRIQNQFLCAAAMFVFLLSAYLLLGLASWLVPDWRVRENVQRSVEVGEMRDDYPKAVLAENGERHDAYTMDMFTDGLIVNQALMLRSEGLSGFLLLPRYQTDKDNQSVSLAALLAVPPDEGGHTPNFSQRTDCGGHVVYYGRYWHGTTFVTRLLLAVMTLVEVRWLLYLLSSLLLLWCCVRLWRTAGVAVALAVPFALLTVNGFVMQFSLQFSPVLLIALAAMLWMTYWRQMDARQSGLLFFVVGSLTAYFDLITVPTLTLGLPLLAWIALQRRECLREGLRMVLFLALWWLAGYVLTWLAKWGLASLLTGMDLFADAYGEASYWTDEGGSYIFKAMSACLSHLHWAYVAAAVLLTALLALWHPRKEGWLLALQYGLVMLIPFVYYLLMARPAWHHSWFNYRALAVAVAALLLAVSVMVDWKKYYSIWKEWRSARR